MIKGLVFDFDGLILDTETPVFESWQIIYQEFGVSLPLSLYANCVGTYHGTFNPVTYLEKRTDKKIDWHAITQKRRSHYHNLIHNQPLLPGVEQYLTEAKSLGLKIGLASSSPRQWIVEHLTYRNLLSYFDAIKGLEDVKQTKPDPELYLANLKELGLKPDETIAFEDSPNGAKAAKSGGLYCVIVPNSITAQLNFERVDLRLTSLSDYSLSELLNFSAWRKITNSIG